mgnify:FL=1
MRITKRVHFYSNTMSFSNSRAVLALIFITTSLWAETAVVVTPASIGDLIRAQNPDLAAARFRIQE